MKIKIRTGILMLLCITALGGISVSAKAEQVTLHFVVTNGQRNDGVTQFDESVEKDAFTMLPLKWNNLDKWNGYTYTNDDPKYEIAGWSTDPDDIEPLFSINPDQDTTLYSIWEEYVTIFLNANGGTWKNNWTKGETGYAWASPGVNASQVVSQGHIKGDSLGNGYVLMFPSEAILEPPAGKGFCGWSYDSGGTRMASIGDRPQSDITLYAVWKDLYDITQKANGGSMGYYQIGSNQYQIVPEKTIKKAKGLLYPVYPYEITDFNSSRYLDAPYPTASGYKFSGWLTDKGEYFYKNTPLSVDSNRNLTALWQRSAQVTFDYKTAGFPNNLGYDHVPQEFLIGEIIDLSDYTGKFGSASITGWSLTSDGSSRITGNSFEVTGDTTLYAIWSASSGSQGNTVEVTVSGNGGILARYMAGQVYKPRASYTMVADTLPAGEVLSGIGNIAVRDNYGFAGWSTSPGGSVVDLSTLTISDDTTLYAKWSTNYHNVTVENFYETGTYQVAAPYGLKYFFDKGRWDTYEFLGFSETPGGALIDTDTYVLNKDVTLYGVYKEPLAGKISASTDPKDYEIPEDEQGGEEPSEEEEKKEPHTKHTYADIFAADVPATFTSHGSQSRHCTGCDLKKDVKVIPRVQEPDLNEDHFTYDGKIHKPGLKVIDVNNTVLKEGTDYTLTYDNDCSSLGEHHVKLTLKGLYSGSRDYIYTIGPAGTKIKKLRASSTSVTLWWKKAKQDIDGYEIAYAKNALFKGAKIKSAKKKTLKLKIKKLKKFKTCYVRIRTYKKVGGKKICSNWSPIKKVKLKK